VEVIKDAIDLFLHLDRHLAQITSEYGVWTYGILFVIIFCETGLVVTPFLPGDSLLFAAGAMAAKPESGLSVAVLSVLLALAAVLGDTVNYQAGHFLGPKVLTNHNSRIFKKEHLDRTHRFFEKYGGRTIVIARFVPIVRTFAPFVAGVGAMTYAKFLIYNVVGGIAWVTGFVLAGFFFGNIPVVKDNFSLVILAIIVVSVLPIVIEFLRAQRTAPVAPRPPASEE
jgi:membrane-associated protein